MQKARCSQFSAVDIVSSFNQVLPPLGNIVTRGILISEKEARV